MALKPFFNHGPIRWGIIGCGNVTEVKSGPPYQMTKDFELTMVMRRDAKKAEDYAQRHGVTQWTTDAAEIIENPNIDAVYIATPPNTHKFYGLQVAKVGKPCCIEKPMAPSYADSLEIYDAFEPTNIPLFIAYYRRSLPRFNKIKEWLDNKLIGEVRHINWLKTRNASAVDVSGEYNWRTDAKIAPGGYFDDLASHGLDLFTYLLGEIDKAKGVASNQQGLYSSFDTISGAWLHKSGVTGSGSWNFGSQKPMDKVQILGSEGEIRFSVLHEEPIELIIENNHESLVMAHPKHLHEYHVENMRKHLFGEAAHPSTGKNRIAHQLGDG
ncbi:Gfo/Idh/MocA family oxidoreductase [Allomuricauda sp. d1]|uniref:Gfo/Idh/MocA family protein n=1 Tax=Allomuricauda sp. d1 TaxID=3136725 RepID=UPI0031D8FC3A